MTTATTTAEVQAAIAAVDTTALLNEVEAKGIEASHAAASKVRMMLEEQLSTANFNLVDELNAKFAGFLQYDLIRERLNILLEKAGESTSSGDVHGALNDAMEEIHEITTVLDATGAMNATAKFFGRILHAFQHGFKSQRQVFVYGMRSLKGKVSTIENILQGEKGNIQNIVEMVRSYLPAVTEDVVRLEYLSRFLEQYLETPAASDLGDDAKQFLKEYHVAVQTMKQVSAVSVLRVIMGLNRIVKAKFHLDKVQMKFTMNLGTLVFENLISNQIATSYRIADSIETGIESLDSQNEKLADELRSTEIAKKSEQLEILKGLEGKLGEIQADYDVYRAEIDRLNGEVDAFLPTYNETYERLTDMRNKALARDAEAGKAMSELLKSDAWDEEKLIAENQQIIEEKEQAMKDVVTAGQPA